MMADFDLHNQHVLRSETADGHQSHGDEMLGGGTLPRMEK